MNKHAAIIWAQKRARKTQHEVFVVWSVEEQDEPGQHYHTSNADDLDGFYSGCEVVAVAQPDGLVEA
jgi:hypothetical protein